MDDILTMHVLQSLAYLVYEMGGLIFADFLLTIAGEISIRHALHD